MKFLQTLLICLISFTAILPTFAQETPPTDSPQVEKKVKKKRIITPEHIAANNALFDSEDLLEVTLRTDLKALKKDIGEEREYHPATLTYQNEAEETVSIDLKVKARGNSRRSKNMCNFPPIRLNFKSENTAETLFEGQNKVKLVAHCQDNEDTYNEYVVREHLVYKAYRLLTDKGFRVRLLKVTYVDTGNQGKEMTKYGFLIEDENFLATRLEGQMVKGKKIHAENSDREVVDRVSIFQYMIGNLDWSVRENHNMKICYISGSLPFCVPYDFDLTGIVHTEYALPPEMLPVNSVRDRLYRGYCRTAEEFGTAFDEFNTIKDNLYALYEGSELLSDAYKKSTLKYLDNFYETINNPKGIKKEFLKKCRKAK